MSAGNPGAKQGGGGVRYTPREKIPHPYIYIHNKQIFEIGGFMDRHRIKFLGLKAVHCFVPVRQHRDFLDLAQMLRDLDQGYDVNIFEMRGLMVRMLREAQEEGESRDVESQQKQ